MTDAPRFELARSAAGTLAGIVAAGVVIALTELAWRQLVGAGVGAYDGSSMSGLVDAAPWYAAVLMLAGLSLAAFAGAWVASRLGRRGAGPGYAVTVLVAAAAVARTLIYLQPLWLTLAVAACAVAAGVLGARLGRPSERPRVFAG